MSFRRPTVLTPLRNGRSSGASMTARAPGGFLGEYERRKAQWVDRNPEATPDEYQRAIKAIANDMGV